MFFYCLDKYCFFLMYDCLLFNYSVFLGNCDDISAFKLLLLLFEFPNITVISYILMCVHTRDSPGIDGVKIKFYYYYYYYYTTSHN